MRYSAVLAALLTMMLVPAGLFAQGKPEAPAPKEAKPAAKAEAPEAVPAPDAPAPEAVAEGGPKKSNRRPYTSTEFEMENVSEVEMESYGKISKIRADSIEKMKELARSNPNYGNIADVYYRIAEYMTENIKFKLAVQGREYKKDLARFKRGEIDKEPEIPVKDYSPTLPFYEKVLVEHPSYPRAEEVLFYLGRNGVETGKALGEDKLVEKSVKVLNKLEEHFPKSRFLPKAYLLSAEYFFNRNNLFEALKYFKKLVDNYKDSPMYLYALYKLGWTYYNYQQHDKTLVCFQEVIESLRVQGRGSETLREMTLSDYVITVSEAGQGWTSHRDFLIAEVGQDRAHEMLHEMARLLAQHGYNDDAVAIYHYFIGLDKNSPEAVKYWNKILAIYRFNYPFEEVEKQVRQLRHFFRPDGAWFGNNKGNAEIADEAADLLVKWDLSLAEFYLEGGLYFNKGDDNFHLAIARSRGVLEQGAGKRQEQAWAGILLAHQGLIKQGSKGRFIFVAENVIGLAYPDDYKLPKKLRRMKLDKNEQAYMEAKGKYLAVAGRTGQKPDLKPLETVDMAANILYTSALVYYTRGLNPEGLKDIDLLLGHDPKSRYAGWAGDMIYQMSARAENWVGLQKRMKTMLDAGNTQVTPEASLKEYLCSGLIQEGLLKSKSKEYGDAMEKLSTATQTCADNINKAGEAYYQLGITAVAGGFIPQAKEAFQKVLNEYGKSKYRSMAQREYRKIKNK